LKVLKFLTVLLLAVIVYISVLICLLGQSLEITLLDTNFPKQVIEETKMPDVVYEDLKILMLSEFATQLTSNLTHDNQGIADGEELQISLILAAYDRSLDNEWLCNQLFNLINDILAVVKKEKQEINPIIDIENINQKLIGNITLEIDALSMEMKELLQSDDTDAPSIAKEIFDSYHIPEMLDITELTTGKVTLSRLEEMINYYQIFRGIYLYFPFVVILTAFMLTCLLTDFSTSFKWVGATILFAALTFLSAAIILSTTTQMFFPELFDIGYLPLNDILIPLIKQGAKKILYLPLLGAGVGFIIMVIGFVSHKKPAGNILNDSD